LCALAAAMRPMAGSRGMLLIRSRGKPSFAAVVADAAGFVANDGPAIRVKVRAAHVIDRAVIGEHAVVPVTARIADPRVAETIIHAAVEADMMTPVTAMPKIKTAAPAPISGRPQRAYIRCKHPGSVNPIVASGTVGPVTGLPHITRPRANGLCIHRQNRWSNTNR